MPDGPTNGTLFKSETDALRAEYLRLVRAALPAAAAAAGSRWAIRLDHCFMRVVLDNVLGRCWTDVLDRRRGPAYRQLDDEQLRRAIAVARSMLEQGATRVAALNDVSLNLRRRHSAAP